jgi:hypothetical protein
LTIETDEDLLFAIFDLTKIKGVSWEDEAAKYDLLYWSDMQTLIMELLLVS